MRALQLEAYDGPSALRAVELDEPVASPGDVLVDVEAIGINFPDLLATQGLYQHRPDPPFVPGCEVAGVVRAAPDASPWMAGDRVAAFVWDGGYAETVRVPLASVVALPRECDSATAAGMVVNYHTAYFALAHRGRLARGETVLVLGAGGGIGSASVQVAAGLGARVIAGVASEEQRVVAEDAGADEVIVLRDGFAAVVRELTAGRGADVVLDPLGDWLFDEAVRALSLEGRVLVVGFAAGGIPTIKVNRLLLRNASVVGVAWGAFLGHDDDLMRRGGDALNVMFERGVVAPRIGARYAFDQIPEALERLGRGEIAGKAVALLDRG